MAIQRAHVPTLNTSLPIRKGLIGYWPLSQHVYSLTGRYHGTLTSFSGVPYAPQQYGQLLKGDGAGYVDMGIIPEMTSATQITISAWLYKASAGDKAMVGSHANPYRYAVLWWSDGTMYFVLEDGTSYGGVAAPISTGIMHVVLVFDGALTGNENRLKGYINGVQQTLSFTGTIPAATAGGGNEVAFRFLYDAGAAQAGGVFDVGLWNRALTPPEVAFLEHPRTRFALGVQPDNDMFGENGIVAAVNRSPIIFQDQLSPVMFWSSFALSPLWWILHRRMSLARKKGNI